VRLVRPRREPRTDLQVWGPRTPAEGRSASRWADIRLSSMTIGVCIVSIAFGDSSGERWQRVSSASKCLVLQCHLVAVRNRPLKHARRVANSVGFVHEVARPSAGSAVPIGPVSGARSLVVGHARRRCDRCGSMTAPFRAEVALAGMGSGADARWALLTIPAEPSRRHACSMRIDQVISASSEPAGSRT
jgi:hypothetical protein